MNNMKNGDKIKMHERLARLETQVESMLKNHLPHIEKKIDQLGTKFWAIILLLVTNLAGLLAGVIVLLLK